jgi:hypothetical protein
LAWFIHDAVEELDIGELLDVYRQCGKGMLAYREFGGQLIAPEVRAEE